MAVRAVKRKPLKQPLIDPKNKGKFGDRLGIAEDKNIPLRFKTSQAAAERKAAQVKGSALSPAQKASLQKERVFALNFSVKKKKK